MFRLMQAVWTGCFLFLLTPLPSSRAQEKPDLAAQLAGLDANVLPKAKERMDADQMLPRFLRNRVHEGFEREAKAFAELKTRADWDKYRAVRLQALRKSLGAFPAAPKETKATVTRTIDADGYAIDNLVFASRPGLFITANLYRPAKPQAAMPGILIIHGFHQPKSQGELQDMGVNWAKLGCAVLVPDQLCHGERRQHPFTDAKSFDGKFNLPRQDYYSRASTGLQLDLVGDSLMGWMVWDAMRCVDVLLALPRIDKDRIIVLGAVAAGGDTAAVTAALDDRIAAVVPFNFGGPEPETAYPLPADAEKALPYGSGGHWDSTRRLRNSARDGFLPWVIVGATAPRRVIYAHEFAWDREHDPVWPRLEKIYKWHELPERLSFAHGSGTLFGKPEGTGCANIGAVHRKPMYPTFKRWFGMTEPEKEVQERRPAEDFLCLTTDAGKQLKPRSVQEIVAEQGAERIKSARDKAAKLTADQRRKRAHDDWAALLDVRKPLADQLATAQGEQKIGDVTVRFITQGTERGLVVPVLLLVPPHKEGEKLPCVVGLAQEGKQGFLKHRSPVIAELLKSGVVVCLPDVRGTGETRSKGDLRGPGAGRLVAVQEGSAGTVLANEEQMLGRTLLGDRLHDLRVLLNYLRGCGHVDDRRIALWGDSFSPTNPPRVTPQVPWDAEKLPHQSEPLGGLLALFGGLFDEDIKAVAVGGSLISFESLLHSQLCFTPPDVVVPGALTAGDLADVAAVLAPRPLRIHRPVDGLNRPIIFYGTLETALYPARLAYKAAKAEDRFTLIGGDQPDAGIAAWLVSEVKAK